MIVFLIKSVVCLALLYAFYYFILEKKKMHKFNRFYLIGILLFSISIPIFNVHFESSFVNPINQLSENFLIENQWSNYLNAIIGVYLIGVGLFFLRFLRNLKSIVNRVGKNPRIWKNSAYIVLLKESIVPHTFLNYIFVNQEDYNSKQIDSELLTHEYSHVNDKHSIDVLFIELFHIVFWFNPMMIYIKKSIRLNHEFIADDEVVKSHQNVTNYQQILLSLAMWKNDNILTSNLNFMVAKKRFEMMIAKSTKKTLLISKVLLRTIQT